MADRVIVAGIKRGGQRLSLVELRQMIGRSGRRHDSDGLVEIFLDSEDEDLEQEMKSGTEPIYSHMTDYAMHLLPMIKFGFIKNLEDCDAWWGKTFASIHREKPNFKTIIDNLCLTDMLDGFNLTELGKVSVEYVFDPRDIACWKNNFEQLLTDKAENNDARLAMALGSVKKYKFSANFEGHLEVFQEFRDASDYEIEDAPMANCVLWWAMLGNYSCGLTAGVIIRDMRKDVGRVMSAIKKIGKIYSWNRDDYFALCEDSLRRGIPSSMRHLFIADHNMTKARAALLVEAGVKSADDYLDFGKNLEFDE